jgi:hypothetical protein
MGQRVPVPTLSAGISAALLRLGPGGTGAGVWSNVFLCAVPQKLSWLAIIMILLYYYTWLHMQSYINNIYNLYCVFTVFKNQYCVHRIICFLQQTSLWKAGSLQTCSWVSLLRSRERSDGESTRGPHFRSWAVIVFCLLQLVPHWLWIHQVAMILFICFHEYLLNPRHYSLSQTWSSENTQTQRKPCSCCLQDSVLCQDSEVAKSADVWVWIPACPHNLGLFFPTCCGSISLS